MIPQYLAEYDVLTYQDLAEITCTPYAIYKVLQKVRRDKFNPDQRIVFYTDQNIPDDLWRHLYQATDLVDISNCFMLICSPSDLRTQSVLQATQWSADKSPFETLKAPVPASGIIQRQYLVPDTVCPLPWSHLVIGNDGTIGPCCVHKGGSIGHIGQSDLNELFHGQYMMDLRQSLLAGQKPTGCRICWTNESRGVISNRQKLLKMLALPLMSEYLEQPKIRSLDLRPGNTCNFKCRICNADSSSAWAQENAKHAVGIVTMPRNWAEDTDRNFDKIFSHVQDLVNIDMYGGEPFLIRPLRRLLDELIDKGNAESVRLHYNSNGSVFPDDLLPRWQRFKHVDLHFSVDDIGPRFELQRGGSWPVVHENIARLKNLQLENVKISIMPVISIMNVLYLDDLFDWAQDLDLPINPLFLQIPEQFSLENLTAQAKDLVLAKYQGSSNPILQRVVALVKQVQPQDGTAFREYTTYFDRIRNQNFASTHQEIADAMGFASPRLVNS